MIPTALKVALTAVALSSTGNLEQEIAPAVDGLYYISESDYLVRFGAAPGEEVSGPAVLQGFGPQLAAEVFTDNGVDGLVTEVTDDAAELLAAMATPASNDPADVEYAARWAQVDQILGRHLTGIRVVKVGPADENGELAIDAGLYAYLVVGLTDEGEIAGILFGAVET
jgi:hypothetical protein